MRRTHLASYEVKIRTLAPANRTYRISNPDPSTTWVHLHILKIGLPIHNLLFSFFEKTVSIHRRFMLLRTFPKPNPLPLKITGFTALSSAAIPSHLGWNHSMPLQNKRIYYTQIPGSDKGFPFLKIFSPIPLFSLQKQHSPTARIAPPKIYG